MSAVIIPFPGKAPVHPMVAPSLFAIARIEEMLAARPVREGLILHAESSKCERRCPTCYLGCAILPDRLAWWENELDKAGGVPAGMLRKDGRS